MCYCFDGYADFIIFVRIKRIQPQGKTRKLGVIRSFPPEGNSMSKLFLFLSPVVEQDRLAAFRRCTFPSDAVSSFVATCLIKNHSSAGIQRRLGLELGGDLGSDEISCNQEPEQIGLLSEYVATGASSQITSIVGALAKIYAQRLVRTARRIANGSGHQCQEKILPRHVLDAHKTSDPGFFLQPSSKENNILFSSTDGNFSSAAAKQKLDDALLSQELYPREKSK